MQDTQVTEAAEDVFSDEPDMLFGVFHGIGEDLGIDPFYLRVAFLGGLFFSPLAMIAAYALLGGVVALARWLFPKPQAALAPAEQPDASAEQERKPELVGA